MVNRRLADKVATVVIMLLVAALVTILFGMIGYIFVNGIGHISWQFLTSGPETFKAGGGIGPQLFNSLYLLVLTLLITVPLGLGGAIYMAEYAKPGKVTDTLRTAIEVLASMPSIVVGMFGLLAFVTLTGWGYTLIGGACALAVFNLPIMVRVFEDAIRSVPPALKQGSMALGVTHWATIKSVILPAALPGIMTGTILASGRVFGEAAALIFTAGLSSPPLDFTSWSFTDPRSPLNPFRPAETLAVHIWKINSEGLQPDVADIQAGASLILVVAVLVYNLGARWFGRALQRKLTASKHVR